MFLSLVPFQQCLRTDISPLYYKLTNGRTEDTVFGNKKCTLGLLIKMFLFFVLTLVGHFAPRT